MKETIKKCGALLAVGAFVLNMAVPSSVLAGSATKPREEKGSQSAFENPSLIGCTPCRADYSTTAVLCASGSGLLYWLSASGTAAAAGKGAMAFDTAVAATIADFSIVSRAIGPLVVATSAAADGNRGNVSPWSPGSSGAPAQFANGLVIKADSATVQAVACYRLNSGINP